MKWIAGGAGRATPIDMKSAHYPFGAGYRHCGQVRNGQGGWIYASARDMNCRLARRIVGEFYFGPSDRKRHHGPENYTGWWTLDRYPGWRCTEGTGGGSCFQHGKIAAFSTL